MTDQASILIADDEESFLQSTGELLRLEGYEVDLASDGQEAACLLDGQVYDLFICDIRMPGNHDLELVRHAQTQNAILPVILVTGYPSMPTAMQAMQLSVIAYLVKPMDFDELMTQVRRGVAFKRLASSLASSSKRMTEWVEEMKNLEASFRLSPMGMSQERIGNALSLVLGNLAGTILDMKSILEWTTGAYAPPGLCTCPRVESLEEATRDAITVLEHTKGSFRSRELGDLRKKLEQRLALTQAGAGRL